MAQDQRQRAGGQHERQIRPFHSIEVSTQRIQVLPRAHPGAQVRGQARLRHAHGRLQGGYAAQVDQRKRLLRLGEGEQ